MGGHAAGEVASQIAVHEVSRIVRENADVIERYAKEHDAQARQEILAVMEHAVQTACASIYHRGQAEADKRGMGTTTSALLIAGDRGFIAHVGDSRIYLLRQNQVHQLTEDHSLINELVRRGKIKRDEIDTSPYSKYKNAVTRAVGVYASVEVDTFDFDILPGDRFLLCSDGMYAYVDEDELPRQLADGDVKDVPKRLVDVANAGGGHDNITAVVIRIGDTTSTELVPRTTDVSLKLEVLKGMQMFRYLSYKELVRVGNIAEMVEVPTEQVIFSAGQPGDAMYVVISGSVRLTKADTPVTELGRGHHFGEMALVDRSVRSLTATAAEGTRLVVIHRKDFYDIIKREPATAVKMLWSFVQVLGARLRKTTNDLSDALHGDRHGQETEVENLFQD
jgi:serine/threonine protein phosphatase PrpC